MASNIASEHIRELLEQQSAEINRLREENEKYESYVQSLKDLNEELVGALVETLRFCDCSGIGKCYDCSAIDRCNKGDASTYKQGQHILQKAKKLQGPK